MRTLVIALLLALVAAAPAHAAQGEGGFISANGGYYRIIGGAALRVGDCAALGGCPGAVPDALSNYRQTPVNGAYLRIPNGPYAGLIVRFASGVPFGLSTCAGVWQGCPGAQNLDVAGYEAYSAAHRDLDNGTFVAVGNGAWQGLIARAVGGVLIGLGTCETLPGKCDGRVDVDMVSFQQYITAHSVMADGTFVRRPDGAIARTVGDALLGIGTCAPLNGCPGYVDLDAVGFNSLASSHTTIADGRFVRVMNGSLAGLVARAAGGRLLYLSDCAALNGCPAAVEVDQTAAVQYQDAHPFVADGTVLKGVPSGQLWRITRAGRTLTADAAGAIEVNDAVLSQFTNLQPAPRLDVDGDGTVAPQDCDDTRAEVHPGAVDVPGDGIDQDCSGADAAFALLDTPIGAFFSTTRKSTRFTSVYVRQVPAGTTVTLRCAGGGCPFKVKRIAVKQATKRLSLYSSLRKARLRKGAQLEISVTHPAMIGRVARIGFRAPKSPKRSNLCLAPGATRAAAC